MTTNKAAISPSTRLNLQSPGDGGETLLEALVAGTSRAGGGFATFAFATARGVRRWFGDDDVAAYLTNHAFELVVGLDAITDVAALDAIKDAVAKYPKLEARAFLHSKKGAIYHPKMAFFGDSTGGKLIVGSGNLTDPGLLTNWEAFTTQDVPTEEARAIEHQWRGWCKEHEPFILPVDDASVLKKAKMNKWIPSRDKNSERKAERDLQRGGDAPTTIPATSVLIAEIPKAGGQRGRWAQFNFGKDVFEKFFGVPAQASKARNIRLQIVPVSASGGRHPLETRKPGVREVSRNFGIESSLARGLDYPSKPPIAVFVKEGPRKFRYRLVMPNDKDFNVVRGALTAIQGPPAKRSGRHNSRPMRRTVTDWATFQSHLPTFKI